MRSKLKFRSRKVFAYVQALTRLEIRARNPKGHTYGQSRAQQQYGKDMDHYQKAVTNGVSSITQTMALGFEKPNQTRLRNMASLHRDHAGQVERSPIPTHISRQRSTMERLQDHKTSTNGWYSCSSKGPRTFFSLPAGSGNARTLGETSRKKHCGHRRRRRTKQQTKVNANLVKCVF